jgi:hypothetical protein
LFLLQLLIQFEIFDQFRVSLWIDPIEIFHETAALACQFEKGSAGAEIFLVFIQMSGQT